MNKLVKGSIAGAAGIALLLGGAGTLAAWNSTADLSSSSIDSGNLTLAASGTWNSTITNWVPGDSSTYTGTLAINATGDNLKAELKLVEDSLVFTGALADAVDITFAVNGTLPAGVTVSGGVYTIAPTAADALSLPVTVTVDFPFGTGVDNTTKQGSADLSGIEFTLTQVTNP